MILGGPCERSFDPQQGHNPQVENRCSNCSIASPIIRTIPEVCVGCACRLCFSTCGKGGVVSVESCNYVKHLFPSNDMQPVFHMLISYEDLPIPVSFLVFLSYFLFYFRLRSSFPGLEMTCYVDAIQFCSMVFLSVVLFVVTIDLFMCSARNQAQSLMHAGQIAHTELHSEAHFHVAVLWRGIIALVFVVHLFIQIPSHCVVQSGLECVILLPPPPRNWDQGPAAALREAMPCASRCFVMNGRSQFLYIFKFFFILENFLHIYDKKHIESFLPTYFFPLPNFIVSF